MKSFDPAALTGVSIALQAMSSVTNDTSDAWPSTSIGVMEEILFTVFVTETFSGMGVSTMSWVVAVPLDVPTSSVALLPMLMVLPLTVGVLSESQSDQSLSFFCELLKPLGKVMCKFPSGRGAIERVCGTRSARMVCKALDTPFDTPASTAVFVK